MMINNVDITKLDIDGLRAMETLFVEGLLQHYDKLEENLDAENNTGQILFTNNELMIMNNAIQRDLVKLQTVRVEIEYRFKTELLTSVEKMSENYYVFVKSLGK